MSVAQLSDNVVRTGPLEFDFDRLEARVNGIVADLTPTETRLLALLARNVGRLVTRDQEILEVWGAQYAGEYFLLRTNIERLRRHLGAAGDLIVTRKTLGHILEDWPVAYGGRSPRVTCDDPRTTRFPSAIQRATLNYLTERLGEWVTITELVNRAHPRPGPSCRRTALISCVRRLQSLGADLDIKIMLTNPEKDAPLEARSRARLNAPFAWGSQP